MSEVLFRTNEELEKKLEQEQPEKPDSVHDQIQELIEDSDQEKESEEDDSREYDVDADDSRVKKILENVEALEHLSDSELPASDLCESLLEYLKDKE